MKEETSEVYRVDSENIVIWKYKTMEKKMIAMELIGRIISCVL